MLFRSGALLAAVSLWVRLDRLLTVSLQPRRGPGGGQPAKLRRGRRSGGGPSRAPRAERGEQAPGASRGFRFEDLTSHRPLDYAQGFPTQ